MHYWIQGSNTRPVKSVMIMRKTKILFGIVVALIVVMPSFSPLSSKSLALREGAYVKWSVELKALDLSLIHI